MNSGAGAPSAKEEKEMANKILVAYFSASGVTAKAAKLIAETAGAGLYEIEPAVRYTKADLDWQDKTSRSTLEMNDPASRPAIAGKALDLSQYDTVFVGFPIWWYVAPRIVNTFLESHDFAGKTVVPFATSGGSGMGKTEASLRVSCPASTAFKPGRIVNGASAADIKAWLGKLGMEA